MGIFCDEVRQFKKEYTKFYISEHRALETAEKVTLPMIQISSQSILNLEASVTLGLLFFSVCSPVLSALSSEQIVGK